jgi:hypothetical protein
LGGNACPGDPRKSSGSCKPIDSSQSATRTSGATARTVGVIELSGKSESVPRPALGRRRRSARGMARGPSRARATSRLPALRRDGPAGPAAAALSRGIRRQDPGLGAIRGAVTVSGRRGPVESYCPGGPAARGGGSQTDRGRLGRILGAGGVVVVSSWCSHIGRPVASRPSCRHTDASLQQLAKSLGRSCANTVPNLARRLGRQPNEMPQLSDELSEVLWPEIAPDGGELAADGHGSHRGWRLFGNKPSAQSTPKCGVGDSITVSLARASG